MTLDLPADTLSVQAGALWARLLEAADGVGQALRRARPLTGAEQRIYALAEAFGGSVLDAEDVTDLRARLYRIGRSDELLQAEIAALRELAPTTLPPAADVEAALANSLGETHLARDCARLLAARVAVIAQVLQRAEATDLAADAARGMGPALVDFRTPQLVRSLFEETLAGEAALFGLLAPLVDPSRWQCAPWMRLALLEQVRLASISHLRLLSVVPDLDIPEDVLPVDERLDPVALAAEGHALAGHVLPNELPVGRQHVTRLLEEIQGSSTTPPGVRALFLD